MIVLGIVLAATAVLDVALARRRREAVLLAAAAATAVAVGAAYVTGHSPTTSVLVAASVLAVEVPAWTFAHRGSRPPLALAAVVGALLFRLVTTPLWTRSQLEPLAERWVQEMPFAFARAGTERITLVVSAALFLATAANTVVRLLLGSLPAVELERSAKLPGGGRVIGSLERLLIFGLALAGEATAAALVISAKGVLRYAGVRAAPEEDVDRVTEYVLVGSLASYTLAMAFVPLALA